MLSSYDRVDGGLSFHRIVHQVSYDGDERSLTSRVEPLFEESIVNVGDVDDFDVFRDGATLRIVTVADGAIALWQFDDVDDEFELEFPQTGTQSTAPAVNVIRFGPRGQWLYATDPAGAVSVYDIAFVDAAAEVFSGRVAPEGTAVTAI